eukprot:GHVP01054742.1.p1 GENE.GHVP01054742.1~~GHVP01054742.1.p1  ORF type:complete len:285 (+),score=44.08 GHVP01054742.1:1010-1864(+)
MGENRWATRVVGEILPQEVLNYEPKPNEIYCDGIRHIFGDLELLPSEIKYIKDFKNFAANRGFVDTSRTFDDERNLLRILQGNQWDFETTLEDAKAHIEWRKANIPVNEKNIRHLLDAGVAYIHGRDLQMKPVIIIRGQALSEVGEDSIVVIQYWLEFILKEAIVKNKVEQWRVIIDMENVYLHQIPITTLKNVLTSLHKNYRSRLTHCCVVNAGYFFSSFWSAVSYILPEITAKKISVLNYVADELLQSINPNQLEKKYGGQCQNMMDYRVAFFPPVRLKKKV